ncbi:MAG: adenylosuccinate lyase [Chloroflexota bacterium]
MNDPKTYQSPFSWRYGSVEMRRVWSEHNKRLAWRKIWIALAEVQCGYGFVTEEQVNDLKAHMTEIDLVRALEIEEEIQHDLMAEIRVFSEQAKLGGGIIHFGATSMDIEDNADALRLQEAADLLIVSLRKLLSTLAGIMTKYADTPLIGFTHLQPAEPSTLGYRFAQYAQDLLGDLLHLKKVRQEIKGKGFKGAVGTSASYSELLGLDELDQFEKKLSQKLELEFFEVSTQTYPRKQDYEVLSVAASLGQSLYKMAFDLRLLQSPVIGEISEPFGSKQVGSSAMPFKRNPIQLEKIDSLGRYLAQLPRIAWDNAAHSLLERTLDDSANRRIILPEGFLAADEMLKTANKVLSGLQVDEKNMQRNLDIYGPFAATEKILMAAVKAGANRQKVHEVLRVHALHAWAQIRISEPNPLQDDLAHDPYILEFISADQIKKLMDFNSHTGTAPRKTRHLAEKIYQEVK